MPRKEVLISGTRSQRPLKTDKSCEKCKNWKGSINRVLSINMSSYSEGLGAFLSSRRRYVSDVLGWLKLDRILSRFRPLLVCVAGGDHDGIRWPSHLSVTSSGIDV